MSASVPVNWSPQIIQVPSNLRSWTKSKLRYPVDDEEVVQGARCVSAPILDSDSQGIAAVSVSGLVTRVEPKQVAGLAGAVASAARAISAAMGFSERMPRGKKPVLARN